MDRKKLQQISSKVRINIIKSLQQAGSGHPGGSLSCTDLLTALYFNCLKHDPKKPNWNERDLFILSKGHACPAHYAVLAEAGYFPVDELLTLRKCGSRLQGHPSSDNGLPGVEIASGSLGMGLSIGVGAALGFLVQKKDSRVYVLMSDGEQQEGSTWEAAMAAGHYKLDNICAVLDYNGLQIDGKVEDVMGIDSLIDKYRSFRWEVIEIDGHDYNQILDAYTKARQIKNKPTIVIARTIKGKGVSFMEDVAGWHGKTPNAEEAGRAIQEILDSGA
ncbi:MAG: transketolase [bacterium]